MKNRYQHLPAEENRPDLESMEPRIMLNGDAGNILAEVAVFGQDRVAIHKDVIVAGGLVASNGAVTVGKDAQVEGIYSNGRISIHKSTTVHGDVIANRGVKIKKDVKIGGSVKSGEKVRRSKGVSVAGDVEEFVIPETFAPIVLPLASEFDTDGDRDVFAGGGASTTLAPGAYGDLILGVHNTLNLSAGEYFFDRITARKGLDLHLDLADGEIAVFVVGNVQLDRNLEVFVGGEPADDVDSSLASNVFLETHGRWQMHKDSQWFGTVFAPTGRIVLHKDTALTGGLYSARTVTIHKDSVVDFVPVEWMQPAEEAVIVDAALVNDSGHDADDGVTNDPTIAGTVVGDGEVMALRAGLNEAPTVDVWDRLNGGQFTLTPEDLAAIAGGPLADGPHVLSLQGDDEHGNVSKVFELAFVLDTTPPEVVEVHGPEPGMDAIVIDFTEDVIVADDALALHNDTAGEDVLLPAGIVSADDEHATWDLTGVDLEAASYTATLSASGVNDIAGNSMAQDHSFAMEIEAGPVGSPGDLDLRLIETLAVFGHDGVAIHKDVTVAGGQVASNGAVAVGKDSQVEQFVIPEPFTAIVLPPTSEFDTDSDRDVFARGGVSTTLAPGAYGDLFLGVHNTLNLSAGEYFFDRISARKGLDLHLDLTDGEIAVFVLGDVHLDRDLEVFVDGEPAADVESDLAADVFLETHGRWQLHKDSQWFGTVLAPTGRIELHKDSAVTGALYSGQTVTIHKDSVVNFVLAERMRLDDEAPIVDAALVNDSGADADDGVTNDPTVAGTVVDAGDVTAFRAGLNGAPTVDVLDRLSGGQFTLTPEDLEAIAGGPVGDGPHVLSLQGDDEHGNVSEVFELAFVLDTTPPEVVEVSVAPAQSPESGIDTIVFTFTEDVFVADDALTLYNDTAGEDVLLPAGILSADGGQATWDLTGVDLDAGSYTATLSAGGVNDIAGNAMVQDYSFVYDILDA